jgi:hypothetical protein
MVVFGNATLDQKILVPVRLARSDAAAGVPLAVDADQDQRGNLRQQDREDNQRQTSGAHTPCPAC